MTRRSRLLAVVFSWAVFSSHTVFGQGAQRFASIGDLALTGGEVLRDCRVGYRTFGTPNADTSNAVLYPTWFGGTSRDLGALIGPGRLIDSTHYFVIAVDALGNGVSSSPSTVGVQKGDRFPRISIRDMVNSQHLLLTTHLGIRHLRAAIGGSMGSMQVFEWLIAYPGFIDRAVPYVCTPRVSTWDLLYFNTELQIIESGKRAKMPDRDIFRSLNMLTAMVAQSPAYIDKHRSRSTFGEFLRTFDRDAPAVFALQDFEAQLRAMTGHDIARGFDGSMELAAQAIRARVFIIVSESDHIIFPGPALEFAKISGAGLLVLKGDGGHLAVGAQLDACSNAIENFLHQQ